MSAAHQTATQPSSRIPLACAQLRGYPQRFIEEHIVQ